MQGNIFLEGNVKNNCKISHLARIIHKYYRVLACPFVHNEPFANRPYAWLRHSKKKIRCNQSFGAIITAIHESYGLEVKNLNEDAP